ncbi:hypothetical protein AC579_2868 [Pseudocercospora musae]|uniref:BTB domain-containing protein n=1 Tax=Pseudocercospora musae TaxID=113226 RepID=A0A139IUH9_9PEZI|nr:hypothetical protein AC579_2868 [Pseudocercospora musae]
MVPEVMRNPAQTYDLENMLVSLLLDGSILNVPYERGPGGRLASRMLLQYEPSTAFARPAKQLPMASVHSPAGRLICAHSKYFDSLFRKQFAESKSRCSQPPDMEPWVFRCFLSWLYTGVIYYGFDAAVQSPPNRRNEPATNEKESEDNEDGYEDLSANAMTCPFRDLFELHVFGDEYDAREFRMSVIDSIQAKPLQRSPTQYEFLSIRDITYITSHVPSSSGLLRFPADAWQFLIMLQSYPDADDEDDELTCEMQEQMERFPKVFPALCAKAAVRNALALACVTSGFKSAILRLGAEEGPPECNWKGHSFEDRLDWTDKDCCVYHEHGADKREEALCQERWANISWRLEVG